MTTDCSCVLRIDQCRSVLRRFLWLIDHGRARQAIELFGDEAVLDTRGERLRGRRQIDAFLAAREAQDRQTVHLVVNEATGRSTSNVVTLTALVVLLERTEGRLELRDVLDSRQTFERDGERWLITERLLHPVHS